MEMHSKRLVISINSSWNFVNFRAGLVRALTREGYEVVAAAPSGECTPELAALGCRHVPLRLSGRGTSPVADAKLVYDYWKLLRRERPCAFLGFTVKPNIFGSLAAHALRIPVINNVAGLGEAFVQRGWLNRLVRVLYRVALRKSAVVFFQNPDDRRQFVDEGLVPGGATRLLPGSGIDTARFAPSLRSGQRQGNLTFIMVARMLWAKGVAEYVDAARVLRQRFPDARFRILGIVDEGQKGAVGHADIDRWVHEGAIEFLGAAADVRPYLEDADVVVLPTFYREGTPRSLLEGAAMAKPLIATDVPGCREIVRDGINGFLVPPRDTVALAEAMTRLIEMSAEARTSLGLASRRIAEEEFDERLVVERYLEALRALDC